MEGGGGDKVEAFLRWAAEMGVSDSPFLAGPLSQPSSPSCLGQSLVLCHFPDAGGRGLAAARELRRGERILRVPKEALLTSESVLKDETLAACTKRHPHLSSTQAEDAIQVSERIVSKVCSDWKDAVTLMQEMRLKPQVLTFRSWLWASATISSRALHVPWNKAGCLCPVGDFFNYAAPRDELFSEDAETEASSSELSCLCKYTNAIRNIEDIDSPSQRLTDGGYEDTENAYCFYARRRYKKGEQVLLCYGTYTNLELLEHYGFLLNVNPNDKAFIQLDADIYTSSSWPKDILYLQQDGRPSFALLSTLRLWATPHNLRRTVGRQAYSGLQLSVENEISVMKWLAERCQAVLHEMPTTVAGDCSTRDTVDNMLTCTSWEDCLGLLSREEELKQFFPVNLSNEGASLRGKLKRSLERFRLAVQWRLIYKRVLLDCIAYCTHAVDMLSSRCPSGKETN